MPAALLMAATAGVEDSQVTTLVTSCLVPSVNMPVAVNCWVVPAAICVDTMTARALRFVLCIIRV